MCVLPVETTEEIDHHIEDRTAWPKMVIASMVCGTLSLASALVVFGSLAVATDGVAVAKVVSTKCA